MDREKLVAKEYWEVNENDFATSISDWNYSTPVSVAQLILLRFQQEGITPPEEIFVDDICFLLEHGCYVEEEITELDDECEDGPYYDRAENEAHGYFYES